MPKFPIDADSDDLPDAHELEHMEKEKRLKQRQFDHDRIYRRLERPVMPVLEEGEDA